MLKWAWDLVPLRGTLCYLRRMTSRPAPADRSLERSSAAIRLLAQQGYDATTAEDLADAVGMSRSTFFRRYGSKDDVIFADHDHALARLEAFLAAADGTGLVDALGEGTTDVLRLLIRDPEAARQRFELMRRTPSLRDRELVITHRYERVYARTLRDRLPEAPAWVAASLSAGIVAVHNRTLRDWLRGDVADAPRAFARDYRRLAGLYQEWLEPGAGGERRVLVAVYDAAGTPDQVLDAVAARLSAEP